MSNSLERYKITMQSFFCDGRNPYHIIRNRNDDMTVIYKAIALARSSIQGQLGVPQLNIAQATKSFRFYLLLIFQGRNSFVNGVITDL